MKIAIIVPIYIFPLKNTELEILRHNINQCKDFKVFLICPKSISNQLLSILGNICFEIKNIEIRNYPSKYFASIKGYNKLLLSSFFYEGFSEYSHIVILQLDAILFKNDFHRFKDFSYIGSPWGDKHLLNLPINSKNPYVGNGGFSLRRTSCQTKIFHKLKWIISYPKAKRIINKRVFIKKIFTFSSKFKDLNFLNLNEDIVWSQVAPLVCPKYKLPSVEIAAQFALETQPEYFYRKYIKSGLPNGCHAWQKYDLNFWKCVIAKTNNKDLTALQKYLSNEK